MSHPKTGITLLRFVDRLPPETSDEDAADFLSQKIHEHGLKVYVRKPNRTSVFANGFPSPIQQHTDVLMSLTFSNGDAREKIAMAKLQGPVIDYGIEDSGISFLELDRAHVAEIASKTLTQVHWFVGDALRVEQGGASAAASRLAPASACLRCLRPSDDMKEKYERYRVSGALKYESEFTYEFRIHDVFVNASDLSSLQFETYKPNKRGDPFGLHDSSFAVYLAYRAAKKFHRSLRNGTKTKEDVIQWLKRSTRSPYRTQYVADQIFKYINPLHRRGMGASVLPFKARALRWFRENYPKETEISDGLALIISASIWWSKEISRREARRELQRFPPTSEVNKKLRYYGFSHHDEMLAILEIVGGARSNARARPKAKTKTEKRLKLQMKSKLRHSQK